MMNEDDIAGTGYVPYHPYPDPIPPIPPAPWTDEYQVSFSHCVLEFPSRSLFPPIAKKGKLYVAWDTNKIYRWDGKTYVKLIGGTTPIVAVASLTLTQGGRSLGVFNPNGSDMSIDIPSPDIPDVPTKLSELENDAGYITSVSWDEVSNKPNFATVAITGDYNDLTNKPEIPVLPQFATVATTGQYSDLIGTPTIPVVPEKVSAFENDAGYITADDIPEVPTLGNGTLTIKQGDTTLGTFSANAGQDAEINIPTQAIPEQVNADWDAEDGPAKILNKPAIPTIPSDIGAASVADATLTDAEIITDWKFNDGLLEAAQEYFGPNIPELATNSHLELIEYSEGNFGIYLVADEGDTKVDFAGSVLSEDELVAYVVGSAMSFVVPYISPDNSIARRVSIPGYQLGIQASKLLQPAGNYVQMTSFEQHRSDTSTHVTQKDRDSWNRFSTPVKATAANVYEWHPKGGVLNWVQFRSGMDTAELIISTPDASDKTPVGKASFAAIYVTNVNRSPLKIVVNGNATIVPLRAIDASAESLFIEVVIQHFLSDSGTATKRIFIAAVVKDPINGRTLPIVPDRVSQLHNDSGFITGITWDEVTGKPEFALVATSSDYNDLTNKPSIPAPQVNADWNAAEGVAQILNKPTLGTAASKDVGTSANDVAAGSHTHAQADVTGLTDALILTPTHSFTDWVCTPAKNEHGQVYHVEDLNNDGSEWALMTPRSSVLDVVSGRPSAISLTFSVAGVTATRSIIGTVGYKLGSQEGKLLAPASFLVEKANAADVNLVPVYSQNPTFTDWVVSPEYSDWGNKIVLERDGSGWRIAEYFHSTAGMTKGERDSLSLAWSKNNDEADCDITATRDTIESDWMVIAPEAPKQVILEFDGSGWTPNYQEVFAGATKGDDLSTSLGWGEGDTESRPVPITVSRTRTDIIGYRLGTDTGSNADKPLQPAGDYALKGEVPTKVSDLNNDAGYITDETKFNAWKTGSSIAAGNDATANATFSVGIGNRARAAGIKSIAISAGDNSNTTNSGGESSVAIGTFAKASAAGSIAIGKRSSVDSAGTNSIQLGESTLGNLSTPNTFRYKDTVIVDQDGKIPSANLDKAFVEKTGDTMTGGLTVPNLTVGSRIDGTTVGDSSVAQGSGVEASGYASHAEGSNTSASGDSSHAEGSSTNAVGNSSHAEGDATTTNGYASHAEGFGTITQNDYEHAQGVFNVSHTGDTNSKKTIHSIGIGSITASTNAVEVMRDGKVYVKDIGSYTGQNNPADSSVSDLATVVNGKVDVNNTGDVSITGKLTVTGNNKSTIFDGEKIYRQNGSNPGKAYQFPDNGGKLALQSEISTAITTALENLATNGITVNGVLYKLTPVSN